MSEELCLKLRNWSANKNVILNFVQNFTHRCVVILERRSAMHLCHVLCATPLPLHARPTGLAKLHSGGTDTLRSRTQHRPHVLYT